MRRLLTFGSFPLIMGAALVGCAVAMEGGIAPSAAMSMVVVTAALLIAALERIHPYIPDYNRSRGDVGTDVLHNLVSMIALPELLRLLTFGAMMAAGSWMSARLGVGLWPTSWPLSLQLVLALVLGEFGSYWTHRLCHENRWLWRLHATHHSAGRLYWLNAGRFHPLDTTFGYVPQMAPLVILGGPDEVFALALALTAVHGMFQHANIDMRLGPLNWVFSMAELHRWHHSKTVSESNTNYGANLIFWDIVFGTRFLPADRDPPVAIGFEGMEGFPTGYAGQILSPFRPAAIVDGSGPSGEVNDGSPA